MAQDPIDGDFGFQSTAAEVLANCDLTDRLIVITGAGGLGLTAAIAFAKAGANIFLGGRTAEKLEAAGREVAANGGQVHTHQLDLMSVSSVDRFADAVSALDRPVDVLLNNAGIFGGPLARNELGIESGLMTSFVGHAVLTSRLASLLVRRPGARVVCVSSSGHHGSPVMLDDLNFSNREYSPGLSYGQSKSACCLLAVKVATALHCQAVDAFALHPGVIRTTGLSRSLTAEELEAGLKRPGYTPAVKSEEQGAATSVWAATEAQLAGRGPLYLEDCAVAPLVEKPNYQFGVMPHALNPDTADRLWAATERMINRELPL
jgi:NAD(P)-dependent dehydrogenase (short-subunit alcohol dehydrogenase family)